MVKDEWQTPRELYNKLDEEFHFDLDVACNKNNCLCLQGNFHELYDSLNVSDWYSFFDNGAQNMDPTCWMNPPYSRGNLDKFCKKAFEESQKGCTVVGLLKMDHSTKWFKNWIYGKAHEVRLCSKRVQFIDPETGKKGQSPNFTSIIVVWKPGLPSETKFSMYDW